MEIFIIIEEDRHADTQVYPYRREDEAVIYAQHLAHVNCDDPAVLLDEAGNILTEAMKEEGWVFYCRYNIEGDSIRVVRRELR